MLWSSAFTFSFSNTTGLRSFIWQLEVNLCTYLLKRNCKVLTFEMGIPAKKSRSLLPQFETVSCQMVNLQCFCKHWWIVWLSFTWDSIPFDFTCFSTVLFFGACVSWQAFHLNCPRTHSRRCSENSLLMSPSDVTELVGALRRILLGVPPAPPH